METFAGKIMNYYRSIGVARVKVSDLLKIGDNIHIKGNTTDFDQRVESLQIRHRQVTSVAKGVIAGLKVNDYVRKHDCVYKVED